MFNFFKKKLTVSECAESAEIHPVVEAGDYKAFVIQIATSSANLSSAIKAGGGNDAVAKFVEIINLRILNKDFEDVFADSDQMHKQFGTIPKRNLAAERIVTCKGEPGHIFRFGA